MCRLCENPKFRHGLRTRTKTLAHFAITSSGSTVTTPCGRTITWQYFRDEIATLPSLPSSGKRVSLRHIRLMRRERDISLSTPRKSSPRITMRDCLQIKNPNSVARHEYRRSVHPSYLRWFIDIVEELEKRSSTSVATSKEVYELAERYIPLLKSCLLKYECSSESPPSIGSDSFIQDILNGMKYRRQNAIRKLPTYRN